MGQRTAWLVPLRPQVVAVLNEIAKRSSYGEGYGSATLLLARLARVVAPPGTPPRSIAAMRQAWWRWTSESGRQASLPPVEELAAIVAFASERGWLSEVRDPGALALMERLHQVADERGATQRRQLERSLAPQVRTAVSDLVEHLVAELAEMPLDEAGTPAIYAPPAPVVQQFARAVGESLIRQLLADLATPLDVFADTLDMSPLELRGETLMRPRSGWPRVLRELAAALSAQLEERALQLEAEDQELDDVDEEAALAALRERIERGEVSPASATAKRAALFSRGGAWTQQVGGTRGDSEGDAREDSES